MKVQENVMQIKEDLDLFVTADEKMEYILDLSKSFKGIDKSEKTEENLLQGCSSVAWFLKSFDGESIVFRADGESAIARGMLSLMLRIYSNHTPQEILEFDPHGLGALGLHELLSPVRQKSLEALIGAIYGYARSCQKSEAVAS